MGNLLVDILRQRPFLSNAELIVYVVQNSSQPVSTDGLRLILGLDRHHVHRLLMGLVAHNKIQRLTAKPVDFWGLRS